MGDGVPDLLESPPEGFFPDPPVDTAEQRLPFDQLTWMNFERLCVRLVRREGTPEHVTQYGTPGQSDHGVDIYSRLCDGSYATYQCKQYERFTESDIDKAVGTFEAGKWRAT